MGGFTGSKVADVLGMTMSNEETASEYMFVSRQWEEYGLVALKMKNCRQCFGCDKSKAFGNGI